MLMNIPTPAQPHSPLCLCVLPLTVCFFCHEKGSGTRWGTSLFFFLKLGQLIQQCSLSGTISLKNPPTPQGTSLKDFPINTIHPTFKQNVCMSNQLLIHYTEWKYMYVFLKSLISYLSPPPPHRPAPSLFLSSASFYVNYRCGRFCAREYAI